MSLDAMITKALAPRKDTPFWEQHAPPAKATKSIGLTHAQQTAAGLMDQAMVLLRFRQFEPAIPVVLKAVSLWPTNPEIQFHAGSVLLEVGRLQEALLHFDIAIQLRPRWADAHNSRSVALSKQGLLQEAIEAGLKSLECAPNVAAYANLCAAYSNLGENEKAIHYGELGVKVSYGTTPMALVNYGIAKRSVWELDEAAGAQIRAIEASGGQDYMAWSNLGAIRNLQGRNYEALAATQRGHELAPNHSALQSNMIMFTDLLPETTLIEALCRRRHWALTYEEPLKRNWPVHKNERSPTRRLKVGYVGADFRQHSAAHIHGAVIRAHDPEQVAVYVYAGNHTEDAISALIREAPALAAWVTTSRMNDLELAAKVYEDQIDILVDCASFTAGGRLLTFACKPAPIQATAWGYATGTGLSAMDVFLADEVIVPEHLEYGYTETVVKMSSLLTFDPFMELPLPGTPPKAQNGYLTFGSLNRVEKISDPILATWCDVLRALPDSRMILKFGGLTHEGRDTETAIQLKAKFAAHGVDPSRIETRGHTDRAIHIQQYGDIDIMLDTWPHVGGITTLEAAMVGVPCVTLTGDRAPSRVSASILTQLGMQDWIATTPEEYVRIAVEKGAADLSTLRQEIPARLKAATLGDTVRYTRELEEVYRGLWRDWCEQIAPLADTHLEAAA